MTRIALASCLFAAVAGCAVDGADDADTDDADETTTTTDNWQPIASVELDTGLTVEFYEPRPGALMVMQSAPAGVPHIPGKPRPIEIHRAFAPQVPVPAALAAAQGRADGAMGIEPHDASAEKRAIDDIVSDYAAASAEMSVGYIDNQDCDDHWFDDEFCEPIESWQWDMCLLNHWNGAYASSSSVNYSEFATCADIGNITLVVTIGSGHGGVWDVLAGHYREYWWYDPLWSESARGDIVNATDNRFHYAVGLDDGRW